MTVRALLSNSKHALLASVIAPMLAYGCGSDGRPNDGMSQESPGGSGKSVSGASAAGTSPRDESEMDGSATSGIGGRPVDAEGGRGGDAISGDQGHDAGAAGEPTTDSSDDGGASGANGGAAMPSGGAAGTSDVGRNGDVGGGGNGGSSAGAAGAAVTGGSGGAGNGAAGAGGFAGARPASNLPCDVQAVLKARCQPCHQNPPLNGAPMPLLTWSDVYGKADEMHAKLSADEMPPPGAPDLSRDQASTLFTYLSLGTPPAGTLTCR
jgi:hypothetical protein